MGYSASAQGRSRSSNASGYEWCSLEAADRFGVLVQYGQDCAAKYGPKFRKDVHIGQLYVSGNVSPEDKTRSSELFAEKFLELYMQEKADWSLGMEI